VGPRAGLHALPGMEPRFLGHPAGSLPSHYNHCAVINISTLARCPPLTLVPPSGCHMLLYMLDAQMFPRPQLAPHGEPGSGQFSHLQQVHCTLGDTTPLNLFLLPFLKTKHRKY
jgi:hypothetical protein